MRLRWELRTVKDEPATREMGSPQWKDEEVVRIKTDDLSEMTQRIKDFFARLEARVEQSGSLDARRREEQVLDDARRSYDRWKQNGEQAINGRPLAEWPRMTPALIATLNHLAVFSVEDMAAASDTTISKVHNGLRLRDEAKEYLAASDPDSASAMATRMAEMEAKMEALIAENADLKASKPEPVAEAAPGPKRGRPRKVAA